MSTFKEVTPLLSHVEPHSVIAFVLDGRLNEVPCIQLERTWIDRAEALALYNWLGSALGESSSSEGQ